MSLDDYPKRDQNSDLEALGEALFEACVTKAECFILQKKDRRDYGTDFELEAREGSGATNFRVHDQLKATDALQKRDGSVSISVDRRNLNYLLSQPHSFYLCYHRPTERLLVRSAQDVILDLEHAGSRWQEQSTVTIRFRSPTSDEFQSKLRARVVATGRSWRNDRLRWAGTAPEFIHKEVARHVPTIELPESPDGAFEFLVTLYEAGREDVISKAFEHFVARFGIDDERMLYAYLAEINLAMRHQAFDQDRIRSATKFLQVVNAADQAGALYCRANGHLALEEWAIAKDLYTDSINLIGSKNDVFAAQCWKNLGSAYRGLGDEVEEARCYEKAKILDPNQAEASMAVAEQAIARTDADSALRHLDHNVWAVDSLDLTLASRAHRAKILFSIGRIERGLDDLAVILPHGHRLEWILPWSARTVFELSREAPDSVFQNVTFWSGYLRMEPNDLEAKKERLLCLAYAKMNDQPVSIDFSRFEGMVLAFLKEDDSDAAHLWDRLGHWAQADGQWPDAAAAYRNAYALEPERYGYCLGAALNQLGHFDEALPILLDQANNYMPDERSWFQVAVAMEGTKNFDGSENAYHRALELNPEYELAMFNLGGLYWNQRKIEQARTTWKGAIERFPDHPVSEKIRALVPSFFTE